MGHPLGFTLIELLIVILIIGIVSAAVIPTVISTLRERQVLAASRMLQAALVGARDAAANAGAPRGIRLILDPTLAPTLASGLPDPSKATAANRWVGLEVPPAYREGRVSTYPGAAYPATVTGGLPALVLEESPGTWTRSGGAWTYLPNSPVSWFWNARVGDKIRLGVSTFTVIGPRVDASSSEWFVNVGPPSTASPLTRTVTAPDGTTVDITPQYLLLTNGQDDDGDGFVDNGRDGIDNDLTNGVDDAVVNAAGRVGEWEVEQWPSSVPAMLDAPYELMRRPVPSTTILAGALPSGAVVDLTTWGTTRERSRLAMDPSTGSVDILIDANGQASVSLPYGVPTSVGMSAPSWHFWIGAREDVRDPDPSFVTACKLPTIDQLKGDARIVTLSRSGRIAVTSPGPSDPADPRAPFKAAEQ